MVQFRIEIAGQTAEVQSLFDSTRDYCREYLTQREADVSIRVTPEDLRFEQQALDEEACREGMRRRIFTDPFLERAAIQRQMAEHLLTANTLLLHGSAVAVDGVGYLFMAKCGTGKSTHTRLWREAFGSRAVMVNDDKPFVRLTSTGALLCGAPWSGKHGLHTNLAVPLGGICILERGPENRIWPIPPEEGFPTLCHEGCPPTKAEHLSDYEKLVQRLSERCPLWRMTCTPKPEAAHVAWEAMHTGKDGNTNAHCCGTENHF